MLTRTIQNNLPLHLFVLSCAFSISALWAAPKEAPAQDRLNFAYISPNASSSSVLWVAKEMGRTRPEVLKADPASFIDASFVKAIEEEGFMKRLGQK